MVTVGLRLDAREEQIQISEGLLLLGVAAAVATALVGFALAISFMNPTHQKTFFGRFSFRQYMVELWKSRTYAPNGNGLDASRAHLMQLSR